MVCFIINGAVNARNAEQKMKTKVYWFHSLILSIFTSFFGGTLAPLLCGKTPILLANDLIIPGCIVAWYCINRLNFMPILMFGPVRFFWVTMSTIFRCHGVIKATIMAAESLPVSVYSNVPLVGPIVIGTIMGTAGLFFPFDKGLTPIKLGMPWVIQGSMMTAFFYHTLVNDRVGTVGTIMQGVFGNHSACIIKLTLVTFWLAQVLVQKFVHSEANFLTPFHKLLYLIFQCQGPLKNFGHAKTDPSATVGWDYVTRRSLESWLELLRVLLIVGCLLMGIALSTPATALRSGKMVPIGKVTGVCQLSALTTGGCSPYHMQFESSSGSLGLTVYSGTCAEYRGIDKKASVWNLKTGSVSDDLPVYLSLGEDGRLRTVSRDDNTGIEKVVWTSSSSCKTTVANHSLLLKLDRENGQPKLHCPDGSVVDVR
jgi:hypothetical protein